MSPIIALIQWYRRLNDHLRLAQVPGFVYTTCKFHPSCSEYAELAVRRYGPFRGLVKATGRVFRCNPFSAGGVDLP